MPDWIREARRKLAGSKLSADEREEVARELAGYLEEVSSDAREHGEKESARAQSALAELHEDPRLGAHLYRARKEGNMNDRTKGLWLPALTLLLATIALLSSFQIPGLSHPQYGTLWLRSGAAHWREVFWRIYGTRNFVWLCILPFLAAGGAYWSRRAGSRRAVQAAVGLSPFLIFATMFMVMVYYSLALQGVPPAKALLPALAVDALKWVAIPGAALLLGVLPFLRAGRDRREPSRGIHSAISA